MAAKPSPGQSYKIDSQVHRKRRRRVTPVPSGALLSVLSTIAASSCPVDASPISIPTFLCPFALCDDSTLSPPLQPIRSPRHENHSASSSQSPQPISPRRRRGSVPARYEEGSDGRWRRVTEYTLYGSTVCKECTVSSSKSMDDQTAISASASTTPQKSTTGIPATGDILDSLPSGWKPSNKSSTRTTVILAMSLVLAFCICFLMVGCIFWRKKKRRVRIKNMDIEMKARKRRVVLAEEEDAEKENRVKQRLWARATARWKANARYIARQRRGKRFGDRLHQAQSSSISLREPNGDTASVSDNSSNNPSRRPSISSEAGTPEVLVNSDDHTPPRPSTSSPPAYRINLIPPDNHDTSPSILSPTTASPILRHSQNGLKTGALPEEDDMDYVPYPASAHLATDDKRVLEQLANLASAPPPVDVSSSSAAAPDWPEEDLDDFPEIIHSETGGTLPFSLSLPPPPSGEMVAYHLSFEDLAHDPESAAPSFEVACPDAPPLSQEPDLTPSAPPLLDEEGDFMEPSAPELSDDEPPSEVSTVFPSHSRTPSDHSSLHIPPGYSA